MLRPALASLALLAGLAAPAFADLQEGDIVRLPGTGELRDALPGGERQRLVPGGGLLISFDADGNDIVTMAEIGTGIDAAFEAADENGDGTLSAFEQQAWADSLPTRDESLANPVRFDPNLDRRVSLEEFSQVIERIAESYTSEESGVIYRDSLRAADTTRRREANRDDVRRVREAQRQF